MVCDAPLEHVLLGGVLDFVCLSLSRKTLLSTAYRLLTDCYVKLFKKGEVIPLPSYCVGRGGCVVHPYFDADVRMEVRRGTACICIRMHACIEDPSRGGRGTPLFYFRIGAVSDRFYRFRIDSSVGGAVAGARWRAGGGHVTASFPPRRGSRQDERANLI